MVTSNIFNYVCWTFGALKMAIAGGITPRSGFGPLLFKPSTVSIPIYQLWKTNSFNVGQAMIKSILGSKLICASLRSNDHPRLSYGGDFDNEPFWKTMVKDIAWSLKSVAVFLAEQPSQIKYIEWPTFQSTNFPMPSTSETW
ncbi:uncharacterized protein LOC121970089 isoform X11 [Zingiber officinale]|uniref:uncharacterized protein LOC121970089 isoform X11 n=1 Tax=Zingiber officinale TaxID=94328 RepID=UPI001C4D31B3|nr:uncharacterized protein LOC121970089 isoform X11 [Zingiber officinale]